MNSAFEQELVKYQNLKQVLQDTVEKVRKILNCDRVIIYNASNLPQAEVLVESIAPKCTSILGKVIHDPFLEGDYLEMYCYGMSLTIDNIDQALDVNKSQLEELKHLGVKGVAVAPIQIENKLLAFLVAHQCWQFQPWEEQTVNLLAEKASVAGKALSAIAKTDELKDLNIAKYIDSQINMPESTQISDGNQQEQLIEAQKQLEQERMWIKHFADALQQIRQSFKIKDILQASVREVHRIFNCDRVLIYALTHNLYGKIVAESVSPGWTKAEGKVIKDPCFEAKYLEKYRDGRVRAWENIYEAGMSNCYIEQLEKLEVKANLVVPIIIDGRLFGLLVAHQCSATRQWQQSEILWLTKIALQIGFTLDNAQLLADAQRLRQQAESEKIWTGHFTETIQQIRQSLKQVDVLKASVREVKRVLNCDRVVVYALDQDNYGKIVAESVNHGWTRAEGRVIKDPCFEARYLEQYRDGRVRAWENIYQAGMSNCYVEQLAKLEVKANLVTPIVHQGKLFGLLVAHQCSATRQWQQVEIRWMSQIAAQVGLALDNSQLLEKLEQHTQDTQTILERAATSSANIQRTVQNVTVGFENLSDSCQNFAEVIQQVKDLSKQLAQQSMAMTRVVSLSQISSSNQDSVVELSDNIFALMQELFEATAKIDPLFTNIKTEITAKTSLLESETEQLINEVSDFQTASQKLEQIEALNRQMSNLINNISDALDTQIQNSTFAQDSVQELTNITKRISQQSLAIIQSLNQLVTLGA